MGANTGAVETKNVLLSPPLAWFGVVLERTRQQEEILGLFMGDQPNVTWRYGYVVQANAGAMPVTDVWLRHVKGLTKLEYLDLQGSEVTDVGLKYLKGLTELERLSVRCSQVTDAGLEHLKDLTNLDTLRLSGTQVTEKGIEELRKALPGCAIEWP